MSNTKKKGEIGGPFVLFILEKWSQMRLRMKKLLVFRFYDGGLVI